jgi:hypothetical protein
VVAFCYAIARHPGDRLADTGSPVVPDQAFFLVQIALFVALGYYIYRLWIWKYDSHILFLRCPLGVTLALKGVGWLLWSHGLMTWATIVIGLGTVAISAVMFWFTKESQRFVCENMDPADHVTPYKPPCPDVYWATVAPAMSLVGWMWVLLYLVLVAALADADQLATADAAANILIIFVAITVFPVVQFFHSVFIPVVWWLSLVFLARTITLEPSNGALFAVVWACVGLTAGLLFYALHAHFIDKIRFYMDTSYTLL